MGDDSFCIKTNGKSAHSEQCDISNVLTKVIDNILDIDSFEHRCVIYQRVVTVRTTQIPYGIFWCGSIIK